MRYLISVLFEPRKTYELVREQVGWVSPLLVLGLVTALYQMIIDRQEFTFGMLVTSYGLSVMVLCMTVPMFGLILYAVKSMLKATEGTFLQLCKVKLFSMAPSLLYLLSKITLLQVLGVDVVDAGGVFTATSLQVVDAAFGLTMTVWSVVLLVIGTSVTIGKSGWAIFGRLAIILIAITLLSSL